MPSQYGRYPAIVLEFATFSSFPASAANGQLAVAQDTSTLYIYNTTAMAWEAVGGSGVPLGIGTYDSHSAVANGLQIVSNILYAQSADATHPGMVSTGTQTFAGNKTFTGSLTLSSPLSIPNGGTGQITANAALNALLPSQTGNNGKVLQSDGTNTSWQSSSITTGNLTDVGTDGIVITGGTGAVVGSGTSIAQHVADTTHNGYLSSTDWNTFNGKQASGNYITALTGDVTATGPGSVAATLATVNGNVGSFGSSTSIPSFTVNAKGLITAASPNVVIAPAGTLSGTTLNSSVVTSSLTSLGTQAAALNMGSHQINAVTDPTSAQDAATKNYVDNATAGINPAVAVQAATTSSANTSGFTYNNGVGGIGATFTGSVNTAVTIDGYTFTAIGQRLLVKNDTQSPSGAFNGIYYVTQVQTGLLAPIFTRALDYDQPSDINNTGAIPVINGTVNGTTQWVLSSLVNTVGTDPLTFTQFARNPADYLLKANNLSDVASKSTSFNNLSPMTTGGDIIYGGASGSGTRLANGSSGQVLTSNGGTSAPSWQTNSSAFPAIAIFNESQTSGTSGGTFNSGTWIQRVLNTTVQSQSWATLTSNQITLTSGTYYIRATAPAFRVNRHKAKLRDVTNGVDIVIGSSEYCDDPTNASQTCSIVEGTFTVSTTTTYEIEHQCNTASATRGFGVESSFSVSEIYTIVALTKIG